MFLALVAGRQHDQVGGKRLAAAHPRSPGDELRDIGKLHQTNLAFGNQIGTADIEIIAAAAGEVLELPARSVFAEIELESPPRQPLEKFAVQLLALFAQQDVTLPHQRK